MDTESPNKAHQSLQGMRVLLTLSQVRGDYARRLLTILETAKRQWGWQINVMCRPTDRRHFEAAVAPDGIIVDNPEMLKPALWEQDQSQTAEVERRLREAECKSGVPVGHIVASCPATIGRAYVVAARKRLSSAMADRVLTDNTEPFRIVRRYFAFTDDLLTKVRPDIVFGIEWGTPLQSALWLAASRQGIPAIALRQSKILTTLGYWSTERLMMNRSAIVDSEAKSRSVGPLSEFAAAYLREFRERPAVSKAVATKWGKAGVRMKGAAVEWLLLPYRYARAAAAEIRHRQRGLDAAQRPSAFQSVMAPRLRTMTARRHLRYLRKFEESELAEMKYVYFPIHKETDMPLVYQATAWQDQRNTVQLIAAALPYGYSFLVREHRSNFGSRPDDYYPHLLRLPNVILVHPDDSQFKYLRNAELVVTETGSSGWEGLMFRRKVLTVTPSFYDGSGLSEHAFDINQLGAKVLETLARPTLFDPAEYDRMLGNRIDAEAANTFASDDEGVKRAIGRLADILLRVRAERAAAEAPLERLRRV